MHGPWLDRALRVRQRPQHHERDDDPDQHQRCADDEPEPVAACQRGAGRDAVGDEVPGAGRRQRREHRQTEGAANLGGRVDQAGRETRLAQARINKPGPIAAGLGKSWRRRRVGSTTAPLSQSRSCSELATGPLPEALTNPDHPVATMKTRPAEADRRVFVIKLSISDSVGACRRAIGSSPRHPRSPNRLRDITNRSHFDCQLR